MANMVLVCCDGADEARTQAACRKLDQASLNIEIAVHGTVDEQSHEARIPSARFVLAFFSTLTDRQSGALNQFMNAAVQYGRQAWAHRVFVVPIRFDKCELPESVEHLQWVDIFNDGGLDRIIDLLRGELSIYIDNRDCQAYRTIEIGSLVWFAENLNYEVEESWWYDNAAINAKPFGRLYTWRAAKEACPPGWHIPSVAEWEQLASGVGGSWHFEDSAETYKALTALGGFQAVLGGLRERLPFDACYERGQNGIYWADGASTGAHTFIFGGKVRRLLQTPADKRDSGFSCRCVKNA